MIEFSSASETSGKCIIILNWNSCSDTLDAIGSLTNCPWPIIVVDNASADSNEVGRLRATYPKLRIVENKLNLGYAGGMNTGMKWAVNEGFTHALLLNPDTLPTMDVLRAMDKLSGDAAIVGTAQVTGDLKSYTAAAMLDGRKPRPFKCEDACGEGHNVDIVSGAGLLVELKTAESLGYMDERFFHYKEEYDFCYRIRVSGRQIAFSCFPPLLHKQGGSLPMTSPTAVYYWYRNEVLFLQKHFGAFGWLSGLGIFRNALQAIWRSPGTSKSAIKGVIHGLRGVSGPVTPSQSSGGGR